MQITYTMQSEDYVAFNLYYLRTNPRLRGRMRRAQIVGSVLLLAAAGVYYARWDNPSPFVIGTLLFAAFLYALYIPISVRNSVHKHALNVIEKSPFALGEKTLTLEEDAVRLVGEGENSTYAYALIEQVAQDKNDTYLFLGDMQALIIPHRAFESESEKIAFLNTLQSHIDQARGTNCET